MDKKLEFEYMDAKQLVPYARNAKKHSEEQISKIMGSIQEFGFIAPIIIDKSNNVLAGHGRLLAAQRLGIEKVPCIREEHLTDTQRKAYILADNRISELATWDDDMLKIEIEELKDNDFDLDMLGFDDDFLDEVLKDNTEIIEDDEQDEEKNELAEKYINEAVRKACGEILEQYQKLEGFSFYTPHISKIDFIKFLFYGRHYNRFNSIAFHPIQVKTNGASHSLIEGIELVSNGEINPERLRWCTQDKIQNILNGSLAWAGTRIPADFPTELARDLINEFGSNGKVLDPCAGWGGRLVGFLASTAIEYQGVDASPYQVKGDLDIYECYKDVVDKNKKVSIVCSPFEKFEVKKEYYDMALTSPPYFDVEKYEGGEQSRNYGNYEKWKDCFYKVLFSKVYDSLKFGGIFCLQVGSQSYPLAQDGIELAHNVGFEYIESRETEMINTQTETSKERMERIVIFRKP